MIPVEQQEQQEQPGDAQPHCRGCDPGGLGRRRLLAGAAGTALGVSVLAACGSGSDGSKAAGGTTGSSGPSADGSPGGSAGSSGGGSGSGQAGALAQAADVPVGGAVSAKGPDGKPVLVCQPKAGQFVAFSAICTHMGCTVAPDGSELKCPCHGSTYDLATGDNTGGPAPRPLAPISVTVKQGAVVAS